MVLRDRDPSQARSKDSATPVKTSKLAECQALLLFLFVCGLNILAGHVSVRFQSLLGILQREAEVGKLFLGLRIGLRRGLQSPKLEVEASVSFNEFFQALVILLHRILVELAAFILIEVVIDLVDE